jgi:hypothetical protein
MNDQTLDQDRKRKVRRNVILLVLLAVAFYIGFIALHLIKH